ncbi:MAG: putative metal-binding motif-containing protein [bacterium]
MKAWVLLGAALCFACSDPAEVNPADASAAGGAGVRAVRAAAPVGPAAARGRGRRRGGAGGMPPMCADRDRDGFQDARCNPRVATGGGDCDDENNLVNPGRMENCANAVDNDCNGQAPDTDPACVVCPDLDNDGYQSAACNANRANGADCDDQNPEVNPGVGERCGNGRDDDCAGGDVPCLANCADRDLDGFGDGAGCRGEDCDDTTAAVNPWQSEICGDGIDQDCRGGDLPCRMDCLDRDLDGFGEGAGCINTDCNDADPSVNPGARDLPGDGIDQDCDGRDLVLPMNCIDLDQDGHGDGPGCIDIDCDDGDPRVNASRVEICDNGIDDDCLGGDRPCVRMGTGECMDRDGDGFGPGACPNGTLDCDDDNRGINPDARETCNGVDDNCNGEIDECPLRNQICDGAACVGGPGAPCRADGECAQAMGLACDQELRQCRLTGGQACTESRECAPTAECIILDVCDDQESRCYEAKGGPCDDSCDCTGAWLCQPQTGRCVECVNDAQCGVDDRDTCTGGGFCAEVVGIGGAGRDARVDVIRRIIQCWANFAESNEDVACDILAIEEPVIVGGEQTGFIEDAEWQYDNFACDEDLVRAAGFNAEEQALIRDVFGCGLFDLFNVAWSADLRSSIGDWCIYYAPRKSGFGFPDDTRAAIVVDACDISFFE